MATATFEFDTVIVVGENFVPFGAKNYLSDFEMDGGWGATSLFFSIE